MDCVSTTPLTFRGKKNVPPQAPSERQLELFPTGRKNTSEAELAWNKRVKHLSVNGLKTCKNVLQLLVLITGLGTIYNTGVGDGKLPEFRSLQQAAPALTKTVMGNSTASLSPTASQEEYWRALQPTLTLLRAISPEIADWVNTLHAKDRVVCGNPAGSNLYNVDSDMALVGGYRIINGKLYLAQDFWRQADGDKVATLAHEYRHYRENIPTVISGMVAQLLSGQLFSKDGLIYGSEREDKAFLYTAKAYKALGMPSTSIDYYLTMRGLTAD